MEQFDYSGNELELFATAKNWKSYWSKEIMPFMGTAVLEIGAGLGATAKTLNSKKYSKWLALEPDQQLSSVIQEEVNRGNLPIELEVRTGTSLSVTPDEAFDTVLYIDVLEHIEEDKDELARVKNNLIKGGNIVIVSPAHNFLYSEFDKKIGHYRRYNKSSLRSVIPQGMIIRKLCYLDSVGLLASLGNKLLLRSVSPTSSQVQLWDRYMVSASRWLDPLTGHIIGKSIVCIAEKL